MKRSLARRLPFFREWVHKLEDLEQRYARLKRQRDNLKAELANLRAEPARREKAETFARQYKAQSALPIPPEALRLRVHGAADESTFLSVGDSVATELKKILEEEQRPLPMFERILDFGCGCGRVLRFFEDRPDSWQLFATDIDQEAISWCKENLAILASFTTNPEQPPLSYGSDFFDLVLGISVFTHLPESLEQLWLSELLRIAKPGALLLLSIHGSGSLNRMPASSYDEFARRGFCYARCGSTAGLPEFYQTSFHSEEYIRRHWTKYFNIRRIVPIGHQDMVVCEKGAA